MLLELNVKDIALIRRADVELGEGLNILTGETGAGKSIIIGSIALALGKKAQPEIIREGAEYAYIELVFKPEDEELIEKLAALSVYPEEDGTILISRRIGRTRSVSRINDETVTLSHLREVTELLIDIYGQHEHQSLLDPKKHLEILDAYGQQELLNDKAKVREAFLEYRRLSELCGTFQLAEEERLREMDLAAYEINEIEEAALKEGEEEALLSDYRRMSHAQRIAQVLAEAQEALSESNVGAALDALKEASGYDEALCGIKDQLFDADSILQSALSDIRRYMDSMDMDEARFHEIEERLDLIRGLMAKYGASEAEIEAYRAKKEARLSELRNYEENKRRCEAERDAALERLNKACAALSRERRRLSEIFVKAVRGELLELGFSSVSLSLLFSEKEPAEDGADTVCFMTAFNPGEKPRPLQEVASGGELSRMMLAIKTVLAETDRIPTLIFDEIDTGISGRTAQRVAERLSLIASRHQVICITHLPQIAAMADTHFVIEKAEQEGRSQTEIRRLSEKESLSELARLLGGAEITETVLENAAEMKRLAGDSRQNRRRREGNVL